VTRLQMFLGMRDEANKAENHKRVSPGQINESWLSVRAIFSPYLDGMDFFQLPDELVYSALSPRFPCRDAQIRTLTTLVYVSPCT